jgi:hypothetical protein
MSQSAVPESIVTLPGGLCLPDGARLAVARLRHLTGCEEEWLAEHREAPLPVAVTRLLSAALVGLENVSPTPELVQALLVGDRDFLMLRLREMTFGTRLSAVVECPGCRGRMDVDLETGDIPFERREQTAPAHSLELNGRTVRFRLPTGADQEAAARADEPIEALWTRCLLHHGGRVLSADERAAVVEEMDRLAPQVEVELDLTCPECALRFPLPFDVSSFFVHEMRISAKRLLREVHSLAACYHWTEADILGLRRDRRRAYLALLSDSFQQ